MRLVEINGQPGDLFVDPDGVPVAAVARPRRRLRPAEALIASGNRYSREQLEGIREFLRFGAELACHRAEELADEVRTGDAEGSRSSGPA